MQNFSHSLAALFAGVLFGLGLCVAQMIDPAKVLDFLDILGSWDPSLACVMAGGLAVKALATPFILRRPQPVFGEHFRLPELLHVDRRIVIGGLIFGVGWGLAGYCPGPMLTSLSFADGAILTIVGSYAVGTFATRWWLLRGT